MLVPGMGHGLPERLWPLLVDAIAEHVAGAEGVARRAQFDYRSSHALHRAEHVDVLIVGAGLSGIGAACHLQTDCPGQDATRSSRRATRIGGTWDLFRYPGIRSDSDMFTLGYSLPPVDGREGDRRRPVDPATTSARRRASTAIDRQDPLPPPRRRAPSGRAADARWTVDGRAHRHRRDGRS